MTTTPPRHIRQRCNVSLITPQLRTLTHLMCVHLATSHISSIPNRRNTIPIFENAAHLMAPSRAFRPASTAPVPNPGQASRPFPFLVLPASLSLSSSLHSQRTHSRFPMLSCPTLVFAWSWFHICRLTKIHLHASSASLAFNYLALFHMKQSMYILFISNVNHTEIILPKLQNFTAE
jgi:hypothetical protein